MKRIVTRPLWALLVVVLLCSCGPITPMPSPEIEAAKAKALSCTRGPAITWEVVDRTASQSDHLSWRNVVFENTTTHDRISKSDYSDNGLLATLIKGDKVTITFSYQPGESEADFRSYLNIERVK